MINKRLPPVRGFALALGLFASLVTVADEATLAEDSYSCFIEPSELVDVGSPVAGIVDAVLFERSDAVASGDTVVRLESVIEESNLKLAAAQARFLSEIREYELHLEFAERKYRRAEAMHSRKAITLDQLEQTEADFKVARMQVEKAKHNHRIAELEFERSQRLRDQRNIRSPIDGVIVERLTAPGEYVKDGALLRIARLDPLKVEVILPVESFGEIAEQDTIPIRTHETGQRLEATVEVVDRVVDAASGTYRVTLSLPNPDLAIASGLRCDVEHPAVGRVAAVAER